MGFVGSSILAQGQGTPLFLDINTTTTPGSLQTLFSYTVSATEELLLSRVIVTTRQPGFFHIKSGSDIIGSGRTGPSEMNVEFSCDPTRTIPSNETLVVEFTARAGSPATDIEAYIQASLI